MIDFVDDEIEKTLVEHFYETVLSLDGLEFGTRGFEDLGGIRTATRDVVEFGSALKCIEILTLNLKL